MPGLCSRLFFVDFLNIGVIIKLHRQIEPIVPAVGFAAKALFY
jgi:hypothetical protein